MTNAELVAEIEKLFDCRNGMYGAHCMPEEMRPPGSNEKQYRYATFRAVTRDSDMESLREYLFEKIAALALRAPPEWRDGATSKKLPLYWRFAVAERIQEEIGPSYHTFEVLKSIRTRICIPEKWWPPESAIDEGAIAPRIGDDPTTTAALVSA